VERFRNPSVDNALHDTEPNFCDRVDHLQYYLYDVSGSLVREGTISQFAGYEKGSYPLVFNDLEEGEYAIVLIGNTSDESLEGSCEKMDNLSIYYKGCGQTRDYFANVYRFQNDFEQAQTFEVGLFRIHGVVQYTFKNVPSFVDAIEIEMNQVGGRKWVNGSYEESRSLNQKHAVGSSLTAKDPEFMTGMFPTLPNLKSAYTVHLYRSGESTPFYSQLVRDDLTVVRNQLLSIDVSFHDGLLGFDVTLDNTWNGSSDGGDAEID